MPDGLSYRYLVLPHEADAVLSSATLKKVGELAAAGVTIIGPQAFAARMPHLRTGSLAEIVSADGLVADIEFRTSSSGANPRSAFCRLADQCATTGNPGVFHATAPPASPRRLAIGLLR